MRHILVTGANKGIGLAIAKAILEEHDDTFVFLGSRDAGRGAAALGALSQWKDRVEFVPLDVTDDASVAAAVELVRVKTPELYAVVNNAGVATGDGASLETVMGVNMLGLRRVSEAFLPLLHRGARVVNVTSAAGPSWLANQSADVKSILLDPNITAERLSAFIDAQMREGTAEPYGLSKACANAYTVLFAREHPELQVNACTPGFIETDLTKHFVSGGKSAADMGMKPPSAGARSTMHLLFAALEGNGRYYGSDAKRSPLDRYRAPGSPEFTG